MQNSITNGRSTSTNAVEVSKLSYSSQVVIVGAGLAGLAAAQRLYETGVKDVIILDAQDRIGGRVHTIEHSNYLLELGAQWLHGADDNPLYQWLVEKNMLDDFEDASVGFKGLFCTDNGQQVDRSIVQKVLDILCECKLLMSKNRLSDLIDSNQFKSASDVFRSYLNTQVDLDEELSSHRDMVQSIFEWFLRYETIENCCDSMDEVSITSYTDWTDAGDGTLLNFKQGYISLLDTLSSQFPAKKWIKLNKEVLNIEMLKQDSEGWRDDKGNVYSRPMLVKFRNVLNGAEKEMAKNIEQILCDHVIVTASLGFLKENYKTFFEPQLPGYKAELIESLGFGTVNKIVLQFEAPFWSQNEGIKLLWSNMVTEEFPDWVRDIISFDAVRKQPNLLIGWLGGEGARKMELESDEKVGEICLRLFDRFLPETHRKPTRLIKCICSRWNSNPFIRGSYSFQSMDSFNLQTDKLHEPIYNTSSSTNKLSSINKKRIPRILFAGEATAGKLYSTTHGAIISGWREADRLVDHFLSCNQTAEKGEILTAIRSVPLKLYQ